MAHPTVAHSHGEPSLRRLARFCYRRRRAVVSGWIALVAGLVALSTAAAGTFENEFEVPGTESQAAFELLERSGFAGRAGATIQVVLEAPSGVVKPAVRAEFQQVLDEITELVDDAEVVSPYSERGANQIADDGEIAYAEINLSERSDAAFDAAGEVIRNAADDFDVDGARMELGGDANIVGAESEFGTEALGMVVAVFILLVAFGSVLAMGLPLLTAILGIAGGTALVQLAANLMTMPTFTIQLVLMLGLGVGIDYALLVVTRYRTELRRGLDPEAATVESIQTAGRSVLFAGGTVAISVMGLFLVGLGLTRALAVAAATGVLMTMIAAVTALPAILGFVGHHVDRFGLPHRHRVHDREGGGVAYRWSRLIQRRPLAPLVIALVALIALTIPLAGIRLGFADNGNRPVDDTTRRAFDLLAEGFGEGFNGPLLVTAELPYGSTDPAILDRLTDRLGDTTGVDSVSAPIMNPDETVAIMQVFPTAAPQDAATGDLVHRIRDEVVPASVDDGGIDIKLGGFTAAAVDSADYFAARLPWFIAAVLVLSFLLLTVTFRSLVVPLKAVILNLLSIGAAYGAVVAVFQWGWGAGLIGAGDPGPVATWVPMMLFAIVFGLSMDYEVFLLSRIKEYYDRGDDNSTAVANGLASTARVITAAAAIMFCVFGGFVFSAERDLQIFGLGLATAVLVDATLVRLVVVPATMELLGDRNWWLPTWLERVLPRTHVDHAPDHVPPQPVEP